MTTNVKAQAAYNAACQTTACVEDLPPQTQYAIRRVGGVDKLPNSEQRFAQAYNEAPIVDADENTFEPEILVRPLQAKDGIE